MDLSKLKIVDLKKLISDNQIKCENMRKMKKADLVDIIKTSDYYNKTYNINEEQQLVAKLEMLEKKAGQTKQVKTKQVKAKKTKTETPPPVEDMSGQLTEEEYIPLQVVEDEKPIDEKPKPVKKARAPKKKVEIVETTTEIPVQAEPVKKVRKTRVKKVKET